MRNSVRVLAIALLAPAVCHGGAPIPARLIGPLHDQSAIDGCSWSASSTQTGQGFIFLAEYDQSRVLMNIGGADTELRLISTRGHLKRVGSVATAVYRSNNGAVVHATYRTSWVCPEGSDSCEVTKFDATYEVSTGTRRQIIHATGDVGC